MTTTEWATLRYLKAGDFRYPDKIEYSVVRALDQFIGIIGTKPTVISDYRPGDPRQHGKGLAIDTVWPGYDAEVINSKAISSRLFSGIGVYINESGATSHHFDRRSDRSVDNPATWGGIISHPEGIEKILYVAINTVLDIVKKKEIPLILFLILSGWIIWKLTRGN